MEPELLILVPNHEWLIGFAYAVFKLVDANWVANMGAFQGR
jgi:hypothetical protein